MIDRYQLPIQFDPARLRADLERVSCQEWASHFNAGYHDGGWSGIALRSPGGRKEMLYPAPNASEAYEDTEVLGSCPGFREVIDVLRFPIRSARLLRLEGGATIREHSDFDLGLESGEVRLHVPVITNEKVVFVLGGERVVMREGECWYLDFNQRHRVENLGNSARVHLVVDGLVNDWLLSLFPSEVAAEAVGSTPGGRQNLDLFLRHAQTDPSLQARLASEMGPDAPAAAAIRLGRGLGYRFSAGDLAEARRLSGADCWYAASELIGANRIGG